MLRVAALASVLITACLGAAAEVSLEVRNPAGLAVGQWPTATGVPFPPGVLKSARDVQLLGTGGVELPLQAVCTGVHQDGSVRWLLLDFQTDVAPSRRVVTLRYGAGVTRAVVPRPLRIEDGAETIKVDTRPLAFAVRKAGFNGLEAVALGGSRIVGTGHDGGPYFVDDQGTEYRACLDPRPEVAIESPGPMRTVITARGWYVNREGERKCRFIVRVHAYAGRPYVRLFYTWLMTEDSRSLRFRDIGFRLAVRTGACRFPLDDGTRLERAAPEHDSAHLVQYDFDRFRLHSGEAHDGRGQPIGLASAAGPDGLVAIAVRDFRQLFPKEFSWTPGGLVFHVWPAHGVARNARKAEDATIQHLRYCHEGEVLDFQVPESYHGYTGEHSEYVYRYLRSAKNANAIGLAKTHELLLLFGAQQVVPETVEALVQALHEPPVCMASPEWMCASGVFGAIQPCRADRFPDYERLISGTFDAERRMQAFTRDYGMWNYGDSHTSWDVSRKRWSDVCRVWRNTHHGCCRVPWLLYVRSGDPKYFRYAVRNTRHVLDQDFCHWTSDEFEGLEYPRGKVKGALNDYKGIVHWHSGNRLMDYNSMTDFALWYWHMTGDRWGVEVARDWAEAVRERFSKAHGRREGAGTMAALLEFYKEIWDPPYRVIIDRYFEHMLGTQRDDGSFPQWENYAPWLERYWELTKDPRAAAALVTWADAYLAGYGDACSKYGDGMFVNVLGYAFLITRDPKYLGAGVWELDNAVASIYSGEDELLRGLMMAGQTSLSGHTIQRAPILMNALAEHGEPVQPAPIFGHKIGFALQKHAQRDRAKCLPKML